MRKTMNEGPVGVVPGNLRRVLEVGIGKRNFMEPRKTARIDSRENLVDLPESPAKDEENSNSTSLRM